MDFSTYTKFWTNIVPLGKKIVDQRARSIFDVDFNRLKDQGYKLVMFDVDDTIDDHLGEIPEKTLEFLKSLQSKGFKLGAFSNSKPARTSYLNELFSKLDIYNVVRSDKPNPSGYQEIMNHYKISPNETVMIGDKMGTDIFGAYNAGVKWKILVEPFSEVFGGRKTKLIERIVRRLEKFFAKKV